MKTVKKILCLVLILGAVTAMSFGLVACNNGTDAEYITEKGTLVCGITYNRPMNYPDEEGRLIGFDTEFAEAVAAELGINVKFQVIDWNSKILELNSKNIDCIWNGFTVNEERRGQVEFTKSYLVNSQCVVVKATNLSSYTTAESCSGKKGVAEGGSAGETVAKTLSSSFVSKEVQTACFLEVKSGTADFAVVDITLAGSMVGRGDYSDLAIARDIVFDTEEYAIGFRKGSDMAAKVNAVIDKLITNGKLLEIATKYGLENELIA